LLTSKQFDIKPRCRRVLAQHYMQYLYEPLITHNDLNLQRSLTQRGYRNLLHIGSEYNTGYLFYKAMLFWVGKLSLQIRKTLMTFRDQI